MYKSTSVLILALLFCCTKTLAGSFSQSLFGSEGESSISNPEIRSLSYTLQYMTFAGISSYFVKQLHDDGFFGPIGFKPNYLESISPLAYGTFPKKSNKNLRNAKESIYRKNEILIIRDKLLSSPSNSFQLTQESQITFNDFISREENRNELIARYFK